MIYKLKNMILRKPAMAGFLLILSIYGNNVNAQSGWYITSSVQVSGGRYIFESYNRVFSLYNGIRYEGDNFGISAFIPILTSNYKNISASNGILTPSETTNSKSVQDFGLGDLYGYFDYKIFSNYEDELDVLINARIKIPTASTYMNVGTGEYDFGTSISIRKSWQNFISVIDLGYLKIGDPNGITYQDPFTYGIGIGRFFNYGEYSFLLYYTGYTKIVEVYDAPQQLSLGLNYRASKNIIISAIGSEGIGNFAPDFSLSGGIKVQL
ncbi:MAG: hypothetical protein ABIG69_15970 [Bacteroidota bacterium]